MKQTMFGPEFLNSVYYQWVMKESKIFDKSIGWKKSYQRVSRKSHSCQRFEKWLWFQGFTVKQKNRKRYLVFSGDEKKLTLFLLKYGE